MEGIRTLLRAIAERRQAYRVPLLVIAAVAFTSGCVISFRGLGISPDDLSLAPLLFLALVMVPLTIAYSAINMILMGKAAGVRIGFHAGVRISIYAQLAELLPIPVGAMVRTAALVKAGGTALQSTGLVLAFALLWIACAAVGAGIALAQMGWPAYTLAGGGSIIAIAACLWIARSFGYSIAYAAVLLRVCGLLLIASRLVVAFAAIGVNIPWSASWGFSLATILGSAASLVPAGLGVGEGLSALIAIPVGVLPAAAFLATALNRLTGYVVHLVACSLMLLAQRGAPTGHREKTNAVS